MCENYDSRLSKSQETIHVATHHVLLWGIEGAGLFPCSMKRSKYVWQSSLCFNSISLTNMHPNRNVYKMFHFLQSPTGKSISMLQKKTGKTTLFTLVRACFCFARSQIGRGSVAFAGLLFGPTWDFTGAPSVVGSGDVDVVASTWNESFHDLKEKIL